MHYGAGQAGDGSYGAGEAHSREFGSSRAAAQLSGLFFDLRIKYHKTQKAALCKSYKIREKIRLNVAIFYQK